MIFYGYYRQTASGRYAPFIGAYIYSATSRGVFAEFLLDTGADGTYLPTEYLRLLGVEAEEFRYDVSGVGSPGLEYVDYSTQLRLVAEEGERSIPLIVGIFTDPEIVDFPIPGADVLDQFTLILDRRRGVAALLDVNEPYAFG